VDLELFTKLSRKEMTSVELAELTGIKLRKPEEYFDSLVCLRLLQRDDHGRYSNTTLSDRFYNKANSNEYLGAYLQILGAHHSPFIRAPEVLTHPVNYDMKEHYFDQNAVKFFADAM